MKKLLYLTILSCLMLAFYSCTGGMSEEEKKLRLELEEFKRAKEKDSVYISGLTQEMDMVYNKLDSMRKAEEKIRQITADIRGKRVSADAAGLGIDQNLEEIERQMRENKAMIRELEKKYKESNSQNALLAKQIEMLKKTVEDKEAEITLLRGRVAELEQEVEGLKTKVAATEYALDSTSVVLDDTRTELNTVFYIVGTEKELKKQNIIVNDKKGFKPDARSASYFTSIDKRNVSQIRVGSSSEVKAKNVKLVPARPSGSYTITEEGGVVYLNVTNSNSFWQDKYLAILTKTGLF
ncbi:hypothetical protein [Hugenholtzia roseola]|uniref:Cbp1 family collagen-binding glycoprotein adhesin n=1 Tax=Hugenholtzia roseola TaxID=1002 RepID=UPI0012B59226|nr:hypothetical protein [Hugenholtzia roseola]